MVRSAGLALLFCLGPFVQVAPAQSIEPQSSRPQEFAAFVRDQLELHRQLVKDVDLKIGE
jgi:hypothetical protein